MVFSGARVTGHELVAFDLRTGHEKLVERDPGTTADWFLDWQGNAVAAWGLDDKNWVLWWREKPAAKWKAIRQPLKAGPPKLHPLATASDQRRLIGADYRQRTFLQAQAETVRKSLEPMLPGVNVVSRGGSVTSTSISPQHESAKKLVVEFRRKHGLE